MTSAVAVAAKARNPMVTSTLALWLASGLTIVTGLVRGKFSALYLGPAGMGLIAQLNYFATFASGLALLGLTNGCIKLMAEARAREDDELERRVRSIAVAFPLAAGVVLTAALVPAAPLVGRLLFGGSPHTLATTVAACSIPLALMSGSFVISLQGQSRFTRLARANAVNTIVSTVVVVVLVVLFQLKGAIAAVILTSLATLVVFAVRERRLFARTSFRPSFLFERRTLRAIYAFAAASFILSLLSVTADLITRTLIVHRLGLSSNGIYQPVVMLSSQFFLALVAAVATYLFPRLTGLYAEGRRDEALAEVNSALRLILAVIVPAVVLVVAFAPSLLTIAFSHEFRTANIPLDVQMVGDVLRAIGWILGAVFLPLGLVRIWLWVGVATLLAQVGLSAALVGPFGLNGIAAAYTGAWAVNAGLALFLGYRRCGLSLDRVTKRHVLAGLGIPATALALAVVSPKFGLLTSFLLLCAWFGLTLRRPTVSELVMAMRGRR